MVTKSTNYSCNHLQFDFADFGFVNLGIIPWKCISTRMYPLQWWHVGFNFMHLIYNINVHGFSFLKDIMNLSLYTNILENRFDFNKEYASKIGKMN